MQDASALAKVKGGLSVRVAADTLRSPARTLPATSKITSSRSQHLDRMRGIPVVFKIIEWPIFVDRLLKYKAVRCMGQKNQSLIWIY